MCLFRAIHASAACTSPRWEVSEGPGPAEPACGNQDICSAQMHVSATRQQRSTALREIPFVLDTWYLLVFQVKPGTVAIEGCPLFRSL